MHETTLPIHPLTGLRALGVINGKPVWPVMGGSGEGDGSTGQGGDTGDQGDDTSGTGDDGQADSSKTGDQGGDTKTDGKSYDESYVKGIRDEAAKHRTEKQQYKAALDAIAKALNPDGKGEKLTPEQLTQQLADRDDRIRELETREAVRKAGDGIDVETLLDSTSFRAKLRDLDPNGKDFGDQVAAEVAAAVKARPSLKLNAGSTKSGADFSGADTGSKTKRATSLNEAVARHYSR